MQLMIRPPSARRAEAVDHPVAIEGRVSVAAQLAIRHRKLTMVGVASDVAEVRNIVRRVGQNESGDFALPHQTVVDAGVAGVALDQTMVAEKPDVAGPGRRDARRRGRRVRFPLVRRRVVREHDAVDFPHFEAGHDEVLTEQGQLFELEAKRFDIPGPGLAGAIERDIELAQLDGVEMIDDDAGDFRNPPLLGGLPDPVPLDDDAVGGDQDRPTDPEAVDAGQDLRALLGVATPHLTGRGLQGCRATSSPTRRRGARSLRSSFLARERQSRQRVLRSPTSARLFADRRR